MEPLRRRVLLPMQSERVRVEPAGDHVDVLCGSSRRYRFPRSDVAFLNVAKHHHGAARWLHSGRSLAGAHEVGRRPPGHPQPLRDPGAGGRGDAVPPLSDRDFVKIMVSYVYEARLAGQEAIVSDLPDVWDLWYVCYRLWRPAGILRITDVAAGSGCAACRKLVERLISTAPPGYPDGAPGVCGCWLRWAVRMRSREPRSPQVDCLAMALSFALLKPGAPARAIRTMLATRYRIAGRRELRLTPVDVTRLYPDAYGEEFLAWQAGYLGSGPVEALMLTAPPDEPVCAGAVRSEIRTSLGVMAEPENHIHMPDSPGEALANIEEFFGSDTLREQYGRIELTHGQRRLALHRALLGA